MGQCTCGTMDRKTFESRGAFRAVGLAKCVSICRQFFSCFSSIGIHKKMPQDRIDHVRSIISIRDLFFLLASILPSRTFPPFAFGIFFFLRCKSFHDLPCPWPNVQQNAAPRDLGFPKRILTSNVAENPSSQGLHLKNLQVHRFSMVFPMFFLFL